MGRIIFGLGLIALVIFGLVWAFDPAYKQQRADAAFYAADQARHEAAVTATQDTLRLQQQQRDAQHDAQRAQQLAPITTGLTIWTYVLLGLALGVAVVAGAGFCIVFLGRRALFVQPSTQGVLPTPLVGFDRLAAQSGAALGLFHQAAIQRAIHGPGQTPQSISTHYAPQFRNEQRNAVDGSTGLPLLPLEAVIGVPTFAQLLDQGRIGRGQPLLLGVDEAGDEVSGSWLDLYSTIVSGLPGSGKTTSQRFLACQTALQGARFVIVDPHAGAADDSLAATLAPLSSAFLCAPASDDKAILSAAQLVADIGKRRISGKDTSTYPVILWLERAVLPG